MAEDCLFCKIINGDIPSFKLYEDDGYVVILDKFPGTPGHALIIPKEHAENVTTLSDTACAGVIPLAKRVTRALESAMSPIGVNIVQNNGAEVGQSVMHYHLHVIPRFHGDNYGLLWKPSEATDEKLAELKAAITAFM